MAHCSKCRKELKKPTYKVSQLGYLCGECANVHADEEIATINRQILNLKNQIVHINHERIEAYQNDCDHNFEDTQYGNFQDGKWWSIYRCTICDKEEQRLFELSV